jgi:hypothetical protein
MTVEQHHHSWGSIDDGPVQCVECGVGSAPDLVPASRLSHDRGARPANVARCANCAKPLTPDHQCPTAETTTRNEWGVRGTEAYAARLSHDRGADAEHCPCLGHVQAALTDGCPCSAAECVHDHILSVPAPTLPVYRCVCGEIEANRVHSDTRLSGWHPYAGESVPAPTLPALDAAVVALAFARLNYGKDARAVGDDIAWAKAFIREYEALRDGV